MHLQRRLCYFLLCCLVGRYRILCAYKTLIDCILIMKYLPWHCSTARSTLHEFCDITPRSDEDVKIQRAPHMKTKGIDKEVSTQSLWMEYVHVTFCNVHSLVKQDWITMEVCFFENECKGFVHTINYQYSSPFSVGRTGNKSTGMHALNR